MRKARTSRWARSDGRQHADAAAGRDGGRPRRRRRHGHRPGRGLIDDLPSCAELIERIMAQAARSSGAWATDRRPRRLGPLTRLAATIEWPSKCSVKGDVPCRSDLRVWAGPAHGLLAGRPSWSPRPPAPASASPPPGAAPRRAPGSSISDRHERRLAEAAERLAESRAPAAGDRLRRHRTRPRCSASSTARSREHGRLDVLVNNAGLGGTASVVDMTDEQWHTVLDVTLNGTFRCTRAALRHMIPRGSGRHRQQRLGASGGGRRPVRRTTPRPRPGVMALTRCAAIEAAPAGGAGQRGRAQPRHAPVPGQGHHATSCSTELTAREAFGRAAEPWEVANVIVFLASDYSSYMTGEVVSVSSQHP